MDITVIAIIAVVVIGAIAFFAMKGKTNEAPKPVEEQPLVQAPSNEVANDTSSRPEPLPTQIKSTHSPVLPKAEEGHSILEPVKKHEPPVLEHHEDKKIVVAAETKNETSPIVEESPSNEIEFVSEPKIHDELALVTETPVEAEPVVQEPVAETPVEAEPAVQEPVAETPVEAEPAVQEPVAETPVEAEPVVQEPVAETPVEEFTGPFRILFVDDSKVVRIKSDKALKAAGFEVILAEHTDDALGKLSVNDVHIVVTDIEMPGIDGFGLAQSIRGNASYSSIPVILISSNAESYEPRAKSLGFDFLDKGKMEAEMVKRIKHMLERKEESEAA